MSVFRATYPRRALERVSDRKKRRLAIDDVGSESSSDGGAPIDSAVMVQDSQTSLKGHRDLFGELIPDEPQRNNRTPETKSAPKVTRRKKVPSKDFAMSCPARPSRLFIPTPRIMKIMKDAQTELYSLMGLNKSSSDVSTGSSNSLDFRGVRDLFDKSATSAPSDNGGKDDSSSSVLKGVVAFVDYKIDNDRSGIGIIQLLDKLGAQVEKTFNRKVTHVVFRDGYRKTYDKAIERKIPLVAARWLENSKIAKRMLDPVDYPPIGIDKYTKPREVNYDLPKSLKKYDKFLRQSDKDRDNLIRIKCHNLMKEVKSLNENCRYKIVEENKTPESIVETPEIQKTVKEPDDPYKVKDIISILSDQLCRVLNTDSPVPDEQTSELYFPVSIKILRKYLTPNGNENKTSSELDSDIVKIEDRLNLNVHARQRLRKLLFPCDEELQNMSTTSDFPSPSPPKIKFSAPGRLISTKKKKVENRIKEKETLLQNKNLNVKEKTPEKQIGTHNTIQWRIPTELRPKKTKTKCNTLTQNTIPNMFSRNSSMIFQTPKSSVASPVVVQSISCTGMAKCEVKIMKLCIQKLGTFAFHTKVEPSTTYVITKSQPNRTLNMVFAMAFGCLIVSENWVHESYKHGRWLHHGTFLISTLSDPVKKFQNRRHTFGTLLTFHIFDDAGKMYISDSCQPQAKHLKRLVRVCGGKCTNIETLADVVIGKTPRMKNNISEKWILDCITEGSLLSRSEYRITNYS